MKPTPIPAREIWPGAHRFVFNPPEDDPDGALTAVLPVEALVDGADRVSVRCELEPGDLVELAAGGTVWVTFYGGGLMPFSVDVQPALVPLPTTAGAAADDPPDEGPAERELREAGFTH